MAAYSRLLLLVFIVVGCAQAGGDTPAIRQVIEAEDTSFYQNKDRLAHTKYWHIIPATRWWYSGKDMDEFWTENDYKAAIQNMNIPPADNAACTFSEFFIKVNGNVAWATYDKKTVTPGGETEHTHEFRGMEKIADEWKIISASVHTFTPK